MSKVDPSTLGWVKGEIDETLRQARLALETFAANPADTGSLRFCVTYLHQVAGTLQMVELDGPAALAREIEALAEAMLNDKVPPSGTVLEQFSRAIVSLPEYLNRLQFGQPDIPLRLLPLMNELRASRAAEPLSELELFAPDLSIRPPNRGAKRAISEAEFSGLVKKLRPAFQTALLNWLRDTEAKAPLEKMAEIAAQLEREANVGAIEQLCWVASGYLAALIEGSMAPTAENKKLLGRLDQQIKKLLDGTEKNLVRSSSQALTKAMLFELGPVQSADDKVAQIRRAFDLDALLSPAADQVETQTLPTPEALQSVAGAIGQEIEKAQELLTAYFDPVQQDPGALVTLTALTEKMSAALDLLKVGPLKDLVDELTETCRAITDGSLGASESVSIELAGALLQVEQSARGIHTPDAGWKRHLDDRINGLRALRSGEGGGIALVEGIEISDAALTENEFKQLLSVVAGEVRVNLKKVEEDLEAFATRPQESARIQNVPQYLNQIQGALQILGQERASELTAITNQYIQDLQGQLLAPSRPLFDALAVAIGTIEAYLDGLERDRPNLPELIDMALRQLDNAVGADNPIAHVAAMQKDLEHWLEDRRRGDALSSAILHLKTITAIAQKQSQEKIIKIGSDLGSLLQIVKQDAGKVTEEIIETINKSFEALASLCRRQLRANVPAPTPPAVPAPTPPAAAPLAAISSEEEIVLEGPISAPVPPSPPPAVKKEAKKPVEVDPEILDFFIEDAKEILKLITKVLPAWTADTSNRDHLLELRRAFHTLKGSGRMVNAVDIGELGFAVENLLNRVRDNKVSVSDALLHLLHDVHQALPALIAELEDGSPAGVDVAALQLRANELANNKTPSISDATAAERPASKSELPVIDATLLQIFTTEVRGHLAVIERVIAASEEGEMYVSAELLRAAHTLQGSARALGLEPMADTCAEMEHLLQAMEAAHVGINKSTIKMFGELDTVIAQLLGALNSGMPLSEKGRSSFAQLMKRFQEESGRLGHGVEEDAKPVVPAIAPDYIAVAAAPPPEPVEHEQVSNEPAPMDVDPELLAVFQEEAADILDAIEEALTNWRKDRSDTTAVRRFKRELHTLKGGARMAGAVVMGNLSHNTESLLRKVEDGQLAPDDELVDLFDEVHDTLIVMLDRLQKKRPLPPEAEVLNRKLLVHLGAPPEAETPVAGQPRMQDEEALEEDEGPGKPERREQIKVQTRLLNNLVNYAGEVSIARSRMEQQVFGFREHLSELNRNVTRFREQIRELEIQSESQILYRAEQEQTGLANSDFDPLEFDRYSKLQYLSRSLAETLHDLSTIQNTLNNFASEAETALQQQARVNTELQEGLMRTRMVSFATQAPRLRHIVRQTARELGKRAELYLTGAEVEVDRTVLERMVGPFEHMIRNAIDHGIEGDEERRRANKPVIGKITVHTSHEGSEIVVRFSDDGAGLDLNAIRKQAISRELVKPDVDLTDEEIMQFILLPGFSTARKITHLSGRGVGMDVVHNEVKQLGGTITVETRRGEGTSFVVRLPLTLSITQALMVYVGDQVFAVPLASIVNILEVPVEKLSSVSAGDKSLFNFEDQVYPFMHLATRLGINVPPRGSKKLPVLLVRSGTRQIAIQVDALGGTREVVIKPLGLQLSEIKGLAGATILGDGRVVLILDIGGLWIVDDSVRLVRSRKEEPEVTDLGRRPIIMVVDDSLTVRKVTSRHLQKHGMDVLVAKDGLDALEQLRQQTPDVMLVDIEMPRMDGYELTVNVRSDADLKNIPIIMITSRAGAKHRERAMQLGVDVYMSKPYQEDDLLRNIEAMLTRRTH